MTECGAATIVTRAISSGMVQAIVDQGSAP